MHDFKLIVCFSQLSSVISSADLF